MTTIAINKGGFAEATRRAPEHVMRLERMGAAYPNRLSFMRSLIRRLSAENAVVTRPVWEINDQGYGRAVYSVPLGGDIYSLVAFAQPLAPENRSDRVIAEAWDATYALFDGVPTTQDLDRLEANAPKQEAGRYEATELSLSRSNKSVRFFQHVVDRLSQGQQPDPELVNSVGYLMRTTAVYGNGKLGFGDRAIIEKRPAMRGSFQVEMLNVWLIRGFTLDLVEHVARAKNPEKFTPMNAQTRRSLGIGNSTGLGLAPFLVNHCVLLNNWMEVREVALARVRAVETADASAIAQIQTLMTRAARHLDQWNVADERQMARIIELRREWPEIISLASADWLAQVHPWDRLMQAGAGYSVECQELIAALVLEPYGDLVDDLCDELAADVKPTLEPMMRVGQLADLLDGNYKFALDVDFSAAEAQHFFWYVSEAKLEPRLGKRFEEDGAEKESPLDIARRAQALAHDLDGVDEAQTVAEFLMAHPEHRYVARRVQTSQHHPYCEIHDNLLAADCLPIDMLRYKLALFGASKFDPKSDLWTRINMFQGAPLFEDIAAKDADDWWLPVLGENA